MIDMNASACIYSRMAHELLNPIDAFLTLKRQCGERMSPTHFGRVVARDGRLYERLSDGGDVLSQKASAIRAFIHEETLRLIRVYGVENVDPCLLPQSSVAETDLSSRKTDENCGVQS